MSASRTKTAANPNNCATCQHKNHSDGSWCYMFRDEPIEVCMQHTAREGSCYDPDEYRDANYYERFGL